MANTQMLQQTADKFATDLNVYGKAQRQFNFDADVYNKQLNEYKALVEAYNTNPAVLAYDQAVKNYNSNLLPAYQSQVASYNDKVNTWQNGSVTVSIPLLGNRTGSPEKMYNALASYSGNPAQTESQRNYLMSTFYPGAAPSAPSTPTAPNVQKPGDFTAVKPVFTAEAPKDPGFTKTQMDALAGKQTLAQMERNADDGLIAGMRANTQTERSGGSAIAGLLSRARYST